MTIKALIFLCAAFAGTQASSQTLVTYGNNNFDKSEFLRAYNKNKPATTDKEKALRDYLELYTNFKLKVKAAQEAHIDTLAQIRYDTENFRDQLSANYLDNDKGMQTLIDEAAARSMRDLHIVYFFVPVAETAMPADTMKAFNAAKALYNTMHGGGTDYAAMAATVSANVYPVKFDDGGYVTAFSVPYNMENIIYGAKPGTVTQPYRTPKGWYILNVIDERPDPGKWKVAQIMIAYPPNADYDTKLAVKNKIDSVYRLLQQGMPFDAAAKQFSDDRATYMAGGELPEFSTGRYDNSFEKKVFALKKDNEISRPFETAYGYHIVKRIGVTRPAANDVAFLAELKQKIMQDSRVAVEKAQFIKDITAATGYKRMTGVDDADLLRFADSASKLPVDNALPVYPISNKSIIRFKDGSTIKADEWLKFAKEYNAGAAAKPSSKNLWKEFTSHVILNYYKKHLEEFNDDFRYQMQEFREGNMLFEIMERKVWSRAGADSAGLLAYYNAHKENYKWANSADVLIFSCADEKAAAFAIDRLKTGKTWQDIAAESNSKIQADSGRYEIAQLPVTGNQPKAGDFSNIIKNADGTASFIKFLFIYAPNMQRSFAESRGLVINDYQNVLEQKWVVELRKKYPVKVNEALFRQIVNSN